MANHNNYYNKNLELARNRNKGKQQLEEEQQSNEFVFRNNKDYEENKLKLLDCQIYLYEEPEGRTKKPRVALVFHFKHLFDITIEGVAVDGLITNVERLGLPDGEDGHYYNLTQTFIKCIPLNVVNYGSKGNKLNGTAMLNPRDWAYQALASLRLDNLVQNINQHNYVSSCPPQIEPKESLSDTVRNFASGLFGFGSESSLMDTKEKHSKKKIPVEIPQISTPHVPSEYDQKERQAVVIRYCKDSQWAIIFHFEGDDAFRTVQGAWDEGVLKPSYKKSRPDGDDGMYMELGTIQISPSQVRDLTLKNVYNGAGKDSGVSEMDWARNVCNEIGLLENWNSGTPWKYVHPPQYTVAPDRTVFLLPSSRMGSSKS